MVKVYHTAKKIKDISQEMIRGEIDRIANNYLMYSGWFKDEAGTGDF